ncbi:MAG: hypothetical protein WCO10_02955 [bacterium]
MADPKKLNSSFDEMVAFQPGIMKNVRHICGAVGAKYFWQALAENPELAGKAVIAVYSSLDFRQRVKKQVDGRACPRLKRLLR